MSQKFILAIDQSTTGTKALLINHDGEIGGKCYKEHRQIHPQTGWAEHDPMEILNNVRELMEKLLSKSGKTADDIECIAITNQRETVLAWDRTTGLPVYNAIVWQCNRAGKQCEKIRQMGLEETVNENTGLPLSEFFSAAKLKWIMDNVPEAVKLRDRGNLLCGTIDSWLVWNLSREKAHVTDYSNASRTELFNLKELCWDRQLVDGFGLTLEMLPKVVFSDEIVGHCAIDGKDIPIAGLIGDSHGALFAQNGFKTGLKVTYGTGSSIMLGTGPDIKRCQGLASTVSYAYGGRVNFAIEGNINNTGATVKWLKDNLQLIDSVGVAEDLATQVSDNGGVYFVPAFGGLGAPHWQPAAKALIWGMSFDTDRRHVVRATLESIAYQIADVVAVLEQNSGIFIESLKVDGKPTENYFLMKFQAGITGKKIIKNRVEEASAYGSALMAGLASGYWSREDIGNLIKHKDIIKPEMPESQKEVLLAGWHEAIKLSVGIK